MFLCVLFCLNFFFARSRSLLWMNKICQSFSLSLLLIFIIRRITILHFSVWSDRKCKTSSTRCFISVVVCFASNHLIDYISKWMSVKNELRERREKSQLFNYSSINEISATSEWNRESSDSLKKYFYGFLKLKFPS